MSRRLAFILGSIRKLAVVFFICVFSMGSFAGTFTIAAGSSVSDVVVLYDPTDSMIRRLADTYVDMVEASYPSIEKRSVRSSGELSANMMLPAWTIVYFFHGDRYGISTENSVVAWVDVAGMMNESLAYRHILAVCYSDNVEGFVDDSKEVFTVDGEKDAKVLMVDALFALSSLMVDSSDVEKVEASEKIFTRTIQYVLDNIAELFVRFLLPINPMEAVSLPESSGYAGPVGYIIDAILNAFRDKTLTVGDSYTAGATESGYGGQEGEASAVFSLDWSFSLTVTSTDELVGHVYIEFSTQQSGFSGKILEALSGVEISVEGEGDFTLKLVTEPTPRVEVKNWHLRIRITISKELGLYDLLEKIWPKVKDLIDKLPKKIRGKVKDALNRVKIVPYFGGEFEIFSNGVGDDEYILTVFFGVSMYVDIPIVDIGGGAEVDLSFHFTGQGNFFVLTLDFEFEIDVPWPFDDLEKNWRKSWQKGPGSSEGKQMNKDTDGDGLADAYESSIGTSPTNTDSDNDGLPDGIEVKEYGTDPTDFDTDDDGLTDGDEVGYFEAAFKDPLGDYDGDGKPNIRDWDSDGDGLSDGEEVNGVTVVANGKEYSFTSDPLNQDSDGDGLKDKDEVKGTLSIVVNGTSKTVYANPMSRDSDGDLLHDLEEIGMNSDPLLTDTDFDGVSDYDELRVYSIKWNQTDTDGDGLSDGYEIAGVLVSLYDPISDVYRNVRVTSDPNLIDTDGDGLTDFQEMLGMEIVWQGQNLTVYGDPKRVDTEEWQGKEYGDGVSDFEEVMTGEDGYQTKPDVPDSDGDGLNDNEFFVYGTDPTITDSDSDGLTDGGEVNTWRSNPLKNDTDADGLLDGQEIDYFKQFDPNFDNSSDYDTDFLKGILDFDSDNGGVGDGDELKANNATYTFDATDPADDKWADSDHDGMPNLWERQYNLDENDPSDNSTDIESDGLINLHEYWYGTSPRDGDTDDDRLKDGDEVNTWFSDPLKEDSDGDGIKDKDEIDYFNATVAGFGPSSDYDGDGLTGILDYDSDNDGLSDGAEKTLSESGIYNGRVVDLSDSDTDGEGLLDGEEVLVYHTDPTWWDTDVEGLSDHQEVRVYYTDPLNNDTDYDELDDFQEIFVWGSNATDPDSDDDGITDGREITYFTENYDPSFDASSDYDSDGKAGILDFDSDNDAGSTWLNGYVSKGLNDGEELARGTDPTDRDSDDDLVNDYWEVYGYGFNYTDPFTGDKRQHFYYTDPLNNDTDADGLLDGDEVFGIPKFLDYRNQTIWFYTDPTSKDTDGDGLIDGFEVNGFNITVMDKKKTVITSPMHPDTDDDRISDFEEIMGWNWFVKRTYDVRERLDPIPIGPPILGEEKKPPPQIEMTRETRFASISALRTGFVTDPTDPDTDDDGLTEGAEKYDNMRIPLIRAPTRTIEAVTVPIITNPVNNDTDGDGLLDGAEINMTNPHLTDTDEDGLRDYDEVHKYGTNPLSSDTDNDQLNDRYELFITHLNSTLSVNSTDPLDPDTDKDGLPDGYELSIWHTHPLNNDTDIDSLLDGEEVFTYGTDPFLNDTDNDGLNDYDEVKIYITDPVDPDSDDDGIYDGVEINYYDTAPLIGDENNDGKPDGWDFDYDNDLLSDYEENVIYGTLFYEVDTDEDGVNDGEEKQYLESWGADASGDADKDGLPNLLDIDSDNDGLTDDVELSSGSNPTKADTDGDGLSDFDEVYTFLTDPSKADSDGDLWLDGVDPHPLNVFIPNVFIAIPIIGFLAIGVFFRKKMVSFLKSIRRKRE